MDSMYAVSAATMLGWQRANLKIINKQSRLVPLKHNIAQLKVHNALEIQRSRGLPQRVIIVKARQEGVTTGLEARIFEDITRKANRNADLTSMDVDGTNKVFEMCQTFLYELPAHQKHKIDRTNRKEIKYAPPHRSGLLCQTAGKEVLGRGGTTTLVHATEVAFWRNAGKQLQGLLNEVPSEPDTLVALESTACGDSGEFYNRYWEAVKCLKQNRAAFDGYLPVFLPWYIFPEYKMQIPGYLEGRLEMIPDDPFCEPQHCEQYLAMGIALTPEQWYWRRSKIRTTCGMDIGKFKQEYPATAREAFQSTGWTIFSPVVLDLHEMNCREPNAKIEFFEVDHKRTFRDVLRQDDCWYIWRYPERLHDYVVFGDVCEGLQSDPSDPKSDPDFHACGILDRTRMDVVATFHGRCDTIDYGEQMYYAGRFYNNAITTPEINSCGLAVLNELKRRNYQNIYGRLGGDEELVEKDTVKLGYRTTSLNRKPGIEQLKKSLNNEEIKLYDRRMIEELRTFTNANGRPEAKVGYHDDWVMMLVGLLQVHLTSEMIDEENMQRQVGMSGKDPKISGLPTTGEIEDEDDDNQPKAEDSEDDEDDVWE